jgi:replication initiation protein RepC
VAHEAEGKKVGRRPADREEFGHAPGSTRAPDTKGLSISLQRLKAACPQFESYAKAGISSWRDALVTAGLVRSMLGMSPDAWERARLAMGEAGATVAVAAILERAGEIRSPGGYLRALTMRAQDGKFSVLPMIQALENR